MKIAKMKRKKAKGALNNQKPIIELKMVKTTLLKDTVSLRREIQQLQSQRKTENIRLVAISRRKKKRNQMPTAV